ncbi:MAG: HEAT repeat domain-containing protein [Bacteroidetes bacterium]|jgi:HEAT repeat protein|nr:HEAT repeat domain-containing protein [Bacteroidota bacterium]
MSQTLFVFLILTASVTLLVLLTAVILLAVKQASSRRVRALSRIEEHYGRIVSEFLVAEVSPPSTGRLPEGHFEGYRRFTATIVRGWKRNLAVHRKAFLSVLTSTAADVSGETSERIVFLAYELGFVDELSAKLKHRHWWVRAEAAMHLGQLRARGATAALAAALEDKHAGVRLQALRALLHVVGVEAFGSIFRSMRDLSQWEMMEISVSVREHGPAAVPYLLDGLEARDMTIVELCIELLAEVGFVDSVQRLRAMASSYPNITIRAKAVEALGRLGDARSEGLLIEYIGHPHPVLRLRALGAIRAIGSSAAVPAIRQRVRDGSIDEKVAAARALANAGEQGLASLHAMASGPEGLTRDVVVQVLEEVGEFDG